VEVKIGWWFVVGDHRFLDPCTTADVADNLFESDDALRKALESCASEPIHVPGSIQPHGALIAFDIARLRAEYVSANIGDWIGEPPHAILGRPIDAVFDKPTADAMALLARRRESAASRQLMRAPRFTDGRELPPRVACSYHVHAGRLIVELERGIDAAADDGPDPAQRLAAGSGVDIMDQVTAARTIEHLSSGMAKLVSHVTDQSLPEQAMSDDLAAIVGEHAGFDRTMVYRFHDDDHGEVIAEARRTDAVEPYLGLHYPAGDIPKQARELYLSNRARLIVDVGYEPVPVLSHLATPLDLSFAALRSVSPLHRQYMKNMGVTSTFVISLVLNDRLWGLIACHHMSPRWIAPAVRSFCVLMSSVFATRLQELYEAEKFDAVERADGVFERLNEHVQTRGDVIDAVARDSQPVIDLVGADGVAVISRDGLRTHGVTPTEPTLAAIAQVLDRIGGEEPVATESLAGWLSQHGAEAGVLPDPDDEGAIQGLLAAQIGATDGLWVIWFRRGYTQSVTWGGDPNQPFTVDPNDPTTMEPRTSFAAWTQEVRGHSPPWSVPDRTAAKHLAVRLLASVLEIAKVRAEQAARAKMDFLATMSHEIRTPLSGVIGTAELLAESTLDAEQTQLLDAIQQSGADLLTLVNDVLDLSRIESGRVQLSPTAFSPRDLIDRLLTATAPTARRKGLQISATVDPGVPEQIVADPQRLRQVLTNLVGNALKFTEQGGVTIRVVAGDGGAEDGAVDVEFSVHDTGPGVAPEDRERIFRVFEQTESGRRFGTGGTGMGLAISRDLVERMGGGIRVDAGEDGVGSVFTFTIRAGRVEDALRGRLAGLRLVAVAPDPDAAHALAQAAELTGAQLRILDSTLRLIDLLGGSTVPPDAVVLDHDAGEMSGSAAAAVISRLSDLPTMPLIVLSTDAPDAARAGVEQRMRLAARPNPIGSEALGNVLAHALAGITRATGADDATTDASVPSEPALVLVVEDSELNRFVLTTMLKRIGFDVDGVTDGLAAVEAARSGAYAAILMDWELPGLSGPEAASTIRSAEAAEKRARVPIIAVTAHTGSAVRDAAAAAGWMTCCPSRSRWIRCGRCWVATSTRRSAEPLSPESPGRQRMRRNTDSAPANSTRKVTQPTDEIG
jgi:chemotaxis family two-component system sensor kinase Cph1